MNREQLTQLLHQLSEAADDAARAELIAGATGELTAEQAAELVDSGLGAYDELVDADGSRTDDEVQILTQIADVVEAARGRQQSIEAAETARQQQIADLHGRMRPQGSEEPAEEGSDGDGEGGEPGDGEGQEPAEQAEPAEAIDQPGPEAGGEPAAAAPAAGVPVAASTRSGSRFGGMRSDRASDVRNNGSNWSLTASADIPGYNTGQDINFDQLVDAATRRMQALARIGRSNAATGGVNVAQFTLNRSDSNLVARDLNDSRVLDYAADERRLKGGSLVAACEGTVAQGDIWCSPSDTLWEFCPDMASREGILDLPTVTVRHGGLRWPSTPDFGTVYDKLKEHTWSWTEAQLCETDDAGDPIERPTKPCAELPCPDWNELRLLPRGMCIKADILRNHSWPEQVRDWTQRLMTAHEHLINADTIERMVSLVDHTVTYAIEGTGDDAGYRTGPGAVPTLLGVLELQIENIKARERMARGTTVEVVLPYWVHGLLRSDLSKRLGVDLIAVPDSRINQWFAQMGARVQFVYDWQDLDTADPTTLKQWPQQLQILVYTAGAYVSARQDIISLDSIYDSVNLLGDANHASNKFISLFTEEGFLLGRKCGVSRLLKVDLCANGATTGGVLPTAKQLCPAV
ncbi:major capsid protein [Streptomyces sp. cg35]|uniref:major capsid protein n=1 Tax=Streptomyces sp. cg35 TaxID=3421650 RepID=UPI003D183399